MIVVNGSVRQDLNCQPCTVAIQAVATPVGSLPKNIQVVDAEVQNGRVPRVINIGLEDVWL